MENNEKIKIKLPSVVPVKLLAEELKVSPIEIIKKLMASGVLATINESIDYDTAAIIADEFNFEAEIEQENRVEDKDFVLEKKTMKDRPPVVTVMGHVDHGKTKLLDAIRSTHIIETESGGITQHIGAYQTKIEIKEKEKKREKIITFLDTPGHEAFSKMRAHGANITDLVILVVAADEGVKPQTVEAISHAKAAKVPIIVAINKMDKPEADPDRVKRDLSQFNLIPEEWGGKTPMVPVSAKTGKNINELLETVVLAADLEELKASQDVPAAGMVIESKIQPGKGAVATVIVKEGIFKAGDVFLFDNEFSKIRFMEDWTGKRIKEAKPSDPILIAGFKKTPKVGSIIRVVKDEKTAKEVSQRLQKESSIRTITKSSGLAELSQEAKEGKIKELNIIIRADVKGSLEAIKGSLEDISGEGVKLNIGSEGIGAVTESDINLALASHGAVIAFRVPTPPQILKLADINKVKISKYEIIYELIDDVTAALEGLLEPEIIETVIGKFEVIKVFHREKDKGIVGGKVISGKITPGTKIRVHREAELIGEIKTESVQSGKEKVNEVTKGFECGVSYIGDIKIKIKDIFEFILVEEKVRTLKKKG
ncbi:MAG: translation initiation factor IF-2 [Candidatus Berkelbacteria bacterium]|nr:translation initiation factor IF-2 [Candidatus Berkelbacteria bacterium]